MFQVEFANVIVINKVDLVSEAQLIELKGILTNLNPDAEIVETVRSNVGGSKTTCRSFEFRFDCFPNLTHRFRWT